MVRSVYKPILILIVLFSISFFFYPLILIHNTTGRIPVIFLVLFPLLGIILFYSTFRKSPRVTLDDEFIIIKNLTNTKTFTWSDVQEIFLSKKEYYTGYSMEATIIVFRNQYKLILWDHMYTNSSELRNFINLKSGSKERDPIPNITEKTIYSVNGRIYAGNVFITYNTLLLVGMIIFSFVSMISKTSWSPMILVQVGFIIALYFALGTQMNYFLIDDGYLIIKNHYFPWQFKKLSLNDIEAVDVETPYRRSTGLRILSKNFNSKLYNAGSLRKENWNELLNDLKLIGIPVRDDR